ncbi:MAG: hypothetical protein GY768_13225 [Planctomycetaceae bacterium]|nr:hypothetical protein [Planctomycetaceae bacterium]
MIFQHVNVKLFVDGPMNVDWGRFIEVFHTWVAEQSVDELLIDVADYRHVPMGPGVILVGHEADYFMDNSDNRPGLKYNDKIERPGSSEDRFRHALRAAAIACSRLEADLDGLTFDRHQIQFSINDRAFAPNNEETYQACLTELPELLKKVVGDGEYEIRYDRDPRNLFGADIKTPQPIDLQELAALPLFTG